MVNRCYLQEALLLTLLPLVITKYCSDFDFPQCDKNIIKEIKIFQEGAGTPADVLELVQNSTGYAALSSSYSYNDRNTNCIILYTTQNSLNLTIIPTDGSPTVTQTSDATECGSVITTNSNKTNWYIIFVGNGVITTYVCNVKGAKKGSPVGFVFVDRNSRYDYCTDVIVRGAKGTLNNLGIKPLYSFGDDCFNLYSDQC